MKENNTRIENITNTLTSGSTVEALLQTDVPCRAVPVVLPVVTTVQFTVWLPSYVSQ